MPEIIQELTDTPRRDVRIDRERGVLRGVKIIGCSSRNGREYPNETLREAIPLYENSKVNLDHPEGDPRRPRSYQDRFGVIRNVALRENDGLYADFRFNPKHAVAEQLLWDAEHAPENVGFSHNVEAVVRREKDRAVVEKIVAVRSVDLVADPATTSGLFEAAGPETESFRENRAAEPEKANNAEKFDGLRLLREALSERFGDDVPGLTFLLDENFMNILSTANDETLIRRLVEDRIRIAGQFRKPVVEETEPVSREQFVPENPVDTPAFVKLLKRT